jgi:hypothetical protein
MHLNLLMQTSSPMANELFAKLSESLTGNGIGIKSLGG